MSEEIKEQSNPESRPDLSAAEDPGSGEHSRQAAEGQNIQDPDDTNEKQSQSGQSIEETNAKNIQDDRNAKSAGEKTAGDRQSNEDTVEKAIQNTHDTEDTGKLSAQEDPDNRGDRIHKTSEHGEQIHKTPGQSEQSHIMPEQADRTDKTSGQADQTDGLPVGQKIDRVASREQTAKPDEETELENEEGEDEGLFDDDEDQSERPHFHFRFPKVRILTRKIAEQETLRREAAQDSDTATGQDETAVYDEERVIWIPARLAAIVLIIVVVLGAALVVIFGNIYWKYSGYKVVSSRKQEDTLSAEYCRAGDNILRYSTDGASLLNQSGGVVWDVSYSMNDPQVAECDNVIAIYDKDGTNIVVCDAAGQIGSASTSLPIIRAKVCDSGAVAALQQDSSNAYIEYYDKNGDQIALIKTSMDNPGFPLDFALSKDGQNIAVSYLGYVDSAQTGIVRFYNFGAAGQSQMDNRIADFQYSGVIVPQLEYLDDNTCVGFRSDGFSVYTGSASVKESATVSVTENIQSVFYDASRIGLVVNNSSSGDFDLLVYNTDGREILTREFNFAYKSVEFSGDEISLYNGADFCVFNLYGVEKFKGSYSETPQSIFAVGRNRYVVVRENSLDMIRLK
ncbi:MAG: DUF5711 family protein [Bilifractor sp.]